MDSLLRDYYFSVLEVLVILFVIVAGGLAVYLWLRRHWRQRLDSLKRKHADTLATHDTAYFEALHDHFRSAVAHEFVKGVDYVAKKSAETLEGLDEAQTVLRDKQHRIMAKAHDLTQRAHNVVDVFAPGQDEPRKELLSIRRLVEQVLLELHPYAESKRVTLRTQLRDVEPTLLDRDLTLQALRNVIHNAIKYSHPGGVVEVDLSLNAGDEGAAGMIRVEVTDRGKGISEEDQDTIFALGTRGDGLIDPGSGLGLYLARRAARLQGGDVVLVRSSPNQGSVFRMTLPYRAADLEG